MAWFAEGVNETQLNKDISWWSRSWMAGTLAGPMVSGVLYQRNALFPFLAASLCSVLTLICIVYLNKHFPLNPPKLSENAPDIPGINNKAGAGSLQQIQNRLSVYKISAWIGVCFANMFVGLIVNVTPIFIRDTLHYSARMAGLILLTRAFASIAGFTLLGRFTSWHFRKYFFIILQGLTVLCCLLFFLAGNNIGMYFVPAFFFGFLFAGFNGSSTFYSGIDIQNLRRNPALHEAFSAAGNSIGSLGGGFCFQYTGMGATFLIMMLAQGLGLLVLIFLSKKHR
jgi:predicted MFS family arabinose efflux permease